VDESDGTGADEDGFKLAPTRNELYDAPSIVKLCEMESRWVNDEYDMVEEGIDEVRLALRLVMRDIIITTVILG